eukprot:745895-Hanusia_phi.AAC.3
MHVLAVGNLRAMASEGVDEEGGEVPRVCLLSGMRRLLDAEAGVQLGRSSVGKAVGGERGARPL